MDVVGMEQRVRAGVLMSWWIHQLDAQTGCRPWLREQLAGRDGEQAGSGQLMTMQHSTCRFSSGMALNETVPPDLT